MRKITLIRFILFILPIAVIAHGPSGHKKSGKIEINPSDVLEKCLKLKPNQFLDYSFEASKPLAFNLHYHLLDSTVFHVKEETSEWKEVFYPIKDLKAYCMEWRNSGSDPVTLDYRYSVKENRYQ